MSVAQRRGRRRASQPRRTGRRPITSGRGQRSIASSAMSVISFGFAAMLLVPIALAVPPATAVQTFPDELFASAKAQSLPLTTGSPDSPDARDSYAVTSRAEMLRQTYTRTYTTSWTGPIRWPFPVTVPISSGFGFRKAPCSGCSTDHRAVDFAPGGGVPIYAIAAGVVKEHEDGNGSWGNYVIIEHQINGQTITSSYAHMQHGSSPLVPGEAIEVGEFIGLVGATGQATGKHLHLELKIDDVKVDPFIWLTANAG